MQISKNKNRKLAVINVTTQNQNPSTKTLRNRRRRQRQRQRGLGATITYNGSKRNTSGTRGLLTRVTQPFLVQQSLTQQKSIHDIMQNLFLPSHGIHRGIANGAELSALTRYKYSADYSVPGGAALTFAITPDFLLSSQMLQIIRGNGAGNNVVQNPFIAAAPTGYTLLSTGGPFTTTNPSANSWRVVSFQLKLLNLNSALNKGGALVIGYNPSLTRDGLNVNTTAFTRTAIDQLEWNVVTSGDQSIVFNWVPNEQETQLTSVTPESFSAVVGYINAPIDVPSSSLYRFELDFGIEYVPSPAYRPYVERSVSKVHPDTWFYVNSILAENWERWIVMYHDDYVAMVKMIEMANPGYVGPITRLTAFGSYGTGGHSGDADVIDDVVNDMQGNDGYFGTRLGKAAAQAMKDVACTINPNLPFCETPFEVMSDLRAGPPRLGR